MLTGFGVVMLYSTTASAYGEKMLKLQLTWIAFGLVLAVGLYLFDYRKLVDHGRWLLLAVAAPLAYLATLHFLHKFEIAPGLVSHAPFVKGAIKGAFRWLSIGGRTVQPSEFAKVAIIVFMAGYYGRNPRYAESFKLGLFKPMLAVGAVMFLVLLGGSLSVTVITGGMVVAMLFVAGIRLRYFVLIGVLGVVVVVTALKVSPERMERVVSFQDPEAYGQTSGYQLWSSWLALGSGGWDGVGFNQSRMKQAYLPEAQTDFILAIVGEELGYRAIVAVVVVYLILITSAFMIGIRAADRTGMLMAFGIGAVIGLQAFVNLGVVIGFLPTTGVTAPLISYGGSSMLVTWITIGLLANIARITEREQAELLGNPNHQPEPLLAAQTV